MALYINFVKKLVNLHIILNKKMQHMILNFSYKLSHSVNKNFD